MRLSGLAGGPVLLSTCTSDQMTDAAPAGRDSQPQTQVLALGLRLPWPPWSAMSTSEDSGGPAPGRPRGLPPAPQLQDWPQPGSATLSRDSGQLWVRPGLLLPSPCGPDTVFLCLGLGHWPVRGGQGLAGNSSAHIKAGAHGLRLVVGQAGVRARWPLGAVSSAALAVARSAGPVAANYRRGPCWQNPGGPGGLDTGLRASARGTSSARSPSARRHMKRAFTWTPRTPQVSVAEIRKCHGTSGSQY